MMRSIPQSTCVLLFAVFCVALPSEGQGTKASDVLRYFSNESNLIRYATFHGQPSPSKELRLLLNRQARWDDAGINDPSGAGLRLRFVKLADNATAGAAAPQRYRVFAEGASPDKVFVLNSWMVDDSTVVDPRDMYVNVQGLVLTHEPTAEQEVSLTAPGDELVVQSVTGNGEPIRFALTPRDGQDSIFGTIVAQPIASTVKGCRLEARIAQPNATAVLIVADGFPGKSKVPLVLESAGSQMTEVLDINSDGHAAIAVLTTVPGHVEGMLKASAEGHNCLPSVTVPWSVPAAHPEAKTPAH